MATRRNSSEDDWSVVGSEVDVMSDTSYDEVEPELEPELVEEKQAPCSDYETATVLSLLPTERCCAGYPRDVRVSLLSPTHQEWYVEPPLQYLPRSAVVPSIREAFTGPAVRPRSFPGRLRVAVAAARPSPVKVETPTFSEVTPFKQDQATQTNGTGVNDSRDELSRSALDRSMTMANQLRFKAQELERASLRNADLESAAFHAQQKVKLCEMKIHRNERSLVLAKQRAILSMEYEANLKSIADDLRKENARLTAQIAALSGTDADLSLRSLDDLKTLEHMLTRGMNQVRAALRSKYHAAVELQRAKDLCVVCFEEPVSVVLLPCRHQALCAACAVRVTTCPIDRKDIQNKVLTYGLSAYTYQED